MAWYTGDAWGFTATLSSPPMCPNQSAVMIDAIDAHEAWCPPTLMSVSPRRLAWSIIRVASQRTRRSMLAQCGEIGIRGGHHGVPIAGQV